MSSPIGGNQYFTSVRPSTANAQEVGKDQKVPPTETTPYVIADANVDIAGSATDDLFIIGEPLKAGCISAQAALNAEGSVTDASAAVALGVAWAATGASDTSVPDVATFDATGGLAATAAGAQPGVPGTDLNGGLAAAGGVLALPTGDNAAFPVFPVVRVTTAPGSGETGIVRAKLVSFCP